MNNCRAAMDKSERSIKRNGMSLEDAKENLEKGLLVIRDEAYIENLRREINDSDRKAAAKDSEIDAQSASRNRIEGSIEHARRVYEEKYGTFERTSDDNPKESIAVFRHKMSEITSRRSDIKSQIRQLENDNRDAMVMERDLERIVTNAGLSGRETANGILTADVSSYDELRKEYNRVLKEEDRLKTDFYNRKQKLITSLEDLKACLLYTSCPYDRVLSTMFGAEAARLILNKEFGKMVAMKNNEITSVPLEEIAGKLKTIDPECAIIRDAKVLGIGFGD